MVRPSTIISQNQNFLQLYWETNTYSGKFGFIKTITRTIPYQSLIQGLSFKLLANPLVATSEGGNFLTYDLRTLDIDGNEIESCFYLPSDNWPLTNYTYLPEFVNPGGVIVESGGITEDTPVYGLALWFGTTFKSAQLDVVVPQPSFLIL